MKEYSRQAFRDWLTKLPQDEPPGSYSICPVAAFMASDCLTARKLDGALTLAIDNIALKIGVEGVGWSHMTAAQVIKLIDRLEGVYAKRGLEPVAMQRDMVSEFDSTTG